MMIELTVTFGGENTETFEFDTNKEKEAFIAGLDLAVSEFPDTAEYSDDDVKNYTAGELQQFHDGLDWGDGFSDYEITD